MPPPLLPVGKSLTTTHPRSGISKRLQRVLLSLPLPLPIRRTIAAVPPRLWTLLLLGLIIWTLYSRSGRADSPGSATSTSRTKDSRLGWLDAHLTEDDGGADNALLAAQQASLPQGMTHTFGSDGLVRVGMDAFEHPVTEVLERAEGAWEKERARVVGDMAEWEDEYREGEAGRAVPNAYRHWAQRHVHPPPLPSPNLMIFDPLPASALQRFQSQMATQPLTFTLVFDGGRVTVEWGTTDEVGEEVRERAAGVLTVVRAFEAQMQDMRVTISAASRPRQALPVSTHDILASAHSSGTPLQSTYNDLLLLPPSASRVSSSCPPSSPATLSSPPSPGLTFLYWPREGLDPCRHQWLKEVNPGWFEEGLLGWAAPVLGFVGGGGSTDLILPMRWPEAEVKHDRERGEWREGDVPWEQRESALYWRGPFPKSDEIHPIQRLLHPSRRQPPTLLARGRGFLLSDLPEPLSGMLDVSFSPPSSPSTGLDKPALTRHKWVLDLAVDNEEFEFPEMLLSGALVFRAGMWRTWATERARAWVHYVPVMPDLSDLPALLHYFSTHDKEAQAIAQAGRKWAEDKQRQEGVEGAWFTTLVEYGRMVSGDVEREDW
ncbi:hypothetical protein DACRYDRAFT_102747 [Dacryopinax primogenitus]|uniref:Glycosyl transferase CAP10 domain-containing protein n=1 Tax=Dacryopinax primogenitus (strain DJM 731) TaxID=1858805 RepID=M5FZB0_DACPD|nr:uncharacterized protein DACRYDRAFT_102747 [Dacryopinax primogenitus]EJT96842.1 hypothetical protein DACRYDRAFT_102747 [Dacryopinax primogenitus]